MSAFGRQQRPLQVESTRCERLLEGSLFRRTVLGRRGAEVSMAYAACVRRTLFVNISRKYDFVLGSNLRLYEFVLQITNLFSRNKLAWFSAINS